MEGVTKQDSPLQMLHEFMMDSSTDGASFVKPYDDGLLLLLLPKRYGIPNPIKRHGPWRFMSMVVVVVLGFPAKNHHSRIIGGKSDFPPNRRFSWCTTRSKQAS